MRVNYTLPGLMPMEPSPSEVSRTGDSPFRARIGIAPSPRFLNWRSLLRLEQVPVNAAVIGPPPKPAELDSTDAATMRVTWRRMLDRQVESFAATSDPSRPDTQAIERMLSMLMRFRDDEDDVTARQLAESEG